MIIKKYRIKCLDCHRFPLFELTKQRAEKIIRDHVKLMKKEFKEIHKPFLVEADN